MDRQIRALHLFFFAQANTDGLFQRAINNRTANRCKSTTDNRADNLRHQADATETAKGFGTENTAGNTAPSTSQTVQRPNTQHIINFQFFLADDEHFHKQEAGNNTGNQ